VKHMRDKRKSEKYFEKYLVNQYERIAAKEEKLKQCHDAEIDKQARINIALLKLKADTLTAEFSVGKKKEFLSDLYRNCCKTAQHTQTMSYDTLLRLLSFGIILGCESDISLFINNINPRYLEDKLINCLYSYATEKKICWSGNLLFPDVYSPLNAVFTEKSSSIRTTALTNYLFGWYESCKEFSWYATETNPHDVYNGYWSFESAAIALIVDVDVAELCASEYFPKL